MEDPTASGAQGRRVARRALAILVTVNVMSQLDRQIMNVLVEPVRKDLGLSDTEIGLLVGVAFAAPIQAFAAAQKTDAPFASLFRFVILPMFIFSGTFFPVSQLPELLQVVAYLTPLWHGVALTRAIALDVVDPALAVVNITVLVAFAVVGLLVSFRTFRQKLAE